MRRAAELTTHSRTIFSLVYRERVIWAGRLLGYNTADGTQAFKISIKFSRPLSLGSLTHIFSSRMEIICNVSPVRDDRKKKMKDGEKEKEKRERKKEKVDEVDNIKENREKRNV